ncbi:MAG: Trk system potassium transporter TrkA [Alphaproteobacteria bacterium]|nr:Trk system potassium transporter TrkA [Alphaproteobacteria bacterium]
MKIIVGGAGSVGRSIISYLSRADNDIVVIDTNQERLDEISKEFDVQPVLGSVSRPDIQESVGAENADILIAATDNDEVNLVACQVAYTLFNVKKKIARIDSEYFLSPLWNMLYNDKSLPVDLVISPDQSIAQNILNIVSIPGTREVYPFEDGKIVLIAFKCAEKCPLYQFNISELYQNFADLHFSIVQIMRDGVFFYPKEDETIRPTDEIYLLTFKKEAAKILKAFDVAEMPYENVVLFGGNAISSSLASQMENDDNITSLKIITNQFNSAQKMSEDLNKAIVIYGEMMSDVILSDAHLERADITISVTSQDKDNLLLSLLAKSSNVKTTLSLVNSQMYDNLTNKIQDNIIIDRSTITISKILQDIRHVNLLNAYSLGRGFAEIWELKLKTDTMLEGKKISEIVLPEKCKILAVLRKNELIFELKDTTIELDDILFIIVSPNGIKRTETVLSI